MATSPRLQGAPELLHPGFVAAGAALLIAACFTDAMYYRTALWQWANFSAWLIVFGLVLALVAALCLVLDLATRRAGAVDWIQFILLAAAAVLSVFNAFVHSRDAWTSVVPTGISLSVIVTILLLVAGARGWSVTALRGPVAGEPA